MSATCPNCGHRFAEDGPCEVHGRIRASEKHGLRIDVEFECAGCRTPLIIEDAAAHEGVIGRCTTRFTGGGYRA